MDNAIEFMRMYIIFQMFLAVEVPLGILVILHNVSSSIIEFLDYNLVHTATLIINLLICLSYPLNFGIYCGMSRQFRETFKELFMKVCNETKGIMIVRVTLNVESLAAGSIAGDDNDGRGADEQRPRDDDGRHGGRGQRERQPEVGDRAGRLAHQDCQR